MKSTDTTRSFYQNAPTDPHAGTYPAKLVQICDNNSPKTLKTGVSPPISAFEFDLPSKYGDT